MSVEGLLTLLHILGKSLYSTGDLIATLLELLAFRHDGVRPFDTQSA
jgi:hypothetical protein